MFPCSLVLCCLLCWLGGGFVGLGGVLVCGFALFVWVLGVGVCVWMVFEVVWVLLVCCVLFLGLVNFAFF